MSKKNKLVSRKKWDRMKPLAQGFVQYMEGDLPGSELKDLTNPYKEGTIKHTKYKTGQILAVQEAQDSEE